MYGESYPLENAEFPDPLVDFIPSELVTIFVTNKWPLFELLGKRSIAGHRATCRSERSREVERGVSFATCQSNLHIPSG